MAELPTTTELLLAWDAARPRSQQVEMGMSKLGSCRRQAGYHTQGYPADGNFEPSGISPVLGTSIHETAAAAARMVIPGAFTESLEVSFGGLTGHPDLYFNGILRDIKTVGYSMVLENRQQNGPPPRERWQIHTYAAGLILKGHPVHTVQLDYIARDSGREWIWQEPFDITAVHDAMAWLDEVRHSEVATLPRDFRPDSAFCQSCPFFESCWEAPRGTDDRTVLFTDDPDVARWAAQLDDAGRRRKAAEREEGDARGALDYLRSVSRPGEKQYVAVPGMEREIRFSVSKGKRSPDMPLIAEDYRRAGSRPPMRTGEPVIRVSLVKPKPVLRSESGDGI